MFLRVMLTYVVLLVVTNLLHEVMSVGVCRGYMDTKYFIDEVEWFTVRCRCQRNVGAPKFLFLVITSNGTTSLEREMQELEAVSTRINITGEKYPRYCSSDYIDSGNPCE
ncbi:Uncharacterised protein at_DN0597 [Pycnogonum litorale]